MTTANTWKETGTPGLSPYEEWQESEGVPAIKGYYIEDLKTADVKPWARMGVNGCFINLEGAGLSNDAYICEIPPGKNTTPQRYMFEELIFVLSGRGATTIWAKGGKKQTFEWGEGSLFSPPINVYRQHFNGQGDKPARFLSVTTAPLIINLFHSSDFVFNNDFVFKDRYNSEEDYFSGKGQQYPRRIWDSNFIPDVYSFKLQLWKERGAGGTNVMFEMASNTSAAHISEFPVGTYKKGHRHGPGAHVILLNGTGYSLLWPEGSPMKKVDWRKGSMFVPPDQWFHQHFNTGREPARYLALRWGSTKYGRLSFGVTKMLAADESVKAGGAQIEYEDESPEIRKIFEAELAKNGLRCNMPPAPRK
ncbi:MAG: ethanolamine ammonia lyase-activating protein [Chloroflexi bacterium]|nr:ethanolamine ammonia lyase-activating protein [Chloroflexota bacterium]